MTDSSRFNDVEKECLICIIWMIRQHCRYLKEDKLYFSGFLSANSNAFYVLIDLGLATGDDLGIVLNEEEIFKQLGEF